MDGISSAISVRFKSFVGWMPSSRKCKKVGQTEREFYWKKETFFVVLPRDSQTRETTRVSRFFSFAQASRLAINNVLSILSMTERECQEEGGYSWGRERSLKKKYILIISIIFFKLGSDATIDYKKSATVEYYIQRIQNTHIHIHSCDSIVLAPTTRDYY